MTGYLPVGYELAIELTYPIPEGTSSGLLNGGTQLIGFILTSIYSWVFSTMGDLAANMMIVGLLSFGLLLTIFIPTDLKRQAAHKAIDDKKKLEFGLWLVYNILLYKLLYYHRWNILLQSLSYFILLLRDSFIDEFNFFFYSFW